MRYLTVLVCVLRAGGVVGFEHGGDRRRSLPGGPGTASSKARVANAA